MQKILSAYYKNLNKMKRNYKIGKMERDWKASIGGEVREADNLVVSMRKR